MQRLPDASLDFEVDFDKGANISLGIGIANKDFNVSNSTQGWVAENEGIGYYNGIHIENYVRNTKKIRWHNLCIGTSVFRYI